MPPRHRSLRFGALEALAIAAFAAGGALVARSLGEARAVIGREEAALAFVRRLAEGEASFRRAGRLDRNGDGQPEFGGLEDLHAAGLLAEAPRRDAQGSYVALEGYRVEVLLPGDTEASGHRTFVRSPDRAEARLCALQCAVVAMPARGGARALRGFYLDAQGWLYSAEGVYDPDRDPSAPPPRRELRDERDDGGTEDGPFWRRLEPQRRGSE